MSIFGFGIFLSRIIIHNVCVCSVAQLCLTLFFSVSLFFFLFVFLFFYFLLCLTLCDHMDCSLSGSLCGTFPSKNTGVFYSSRLPFPTPGDLPNPGTEPGSLKSPALQANSLPLSHQGKP